VLPEGAAVRHSLTHVDNLVRAVERALDPAVARGTFNVADESPVVLADVLREFFARRGVKARLFSIPYRSALALAASLETAARLRRRRPALTRYAVSQVGMERTLDLTAARTKLGYTPAPTTLEGAEHW